MRPSPPIAAMIGQGAEMVHYSNAIGYGNRGSSGATRWFLADPARKHLDSWTPIILMGYLTAGQAANNETKSVFTF